jgi:hypothetical protein
MKTHVLAFYGQSPSEIRADMNAFVGEEVLDAGGSYVRVIGYLSVAFAPEGGTLAVLAVAEVEPVDAEAVRSATAVVAEEWPLAEKIEAYHTVRAGQRGASRALTLTPKGMSAVKAMRAGDEQGA